MSGGTPAGDPDRNRPRRPSPGRIAIWVIVGGIGLYLLLSGLIGVLGGGK